VLHELKGLGVEIHFDDFGAGLSSLSLLRSLPLDGLKVDRSFLERSNGDVQAITILNAILALGLPVRARDTARGSHRPARHRFLVALRRRLNAPPRQDGIHLRPRQAGRNHDVLHALETHEDGGSSNGANLARKAVERRIDHSADPAGQFGCVEVGGHAPRE